VANILYPKLKEALLKGQFTTDLSAGGTNVKAVLVDTGTYTYNAAHDFLDDIPAGARVGTSGNLANKTVSTAGVFDADDFSITVGAAQPSAETLVFYVDTGVESTSRLLCIDDTFTSGMPYTPPGGGGTVNVTINASGIFTL
jgi:hypothetical protein